MATRYFINTADGDWGNLLNWFTDPAGTSPLGGLPANGDIIVMPLGSGELDTLSANRTCAQFRCFDSTGISAADFELTVTAATAIALVFFQGGNLGATIHVTNGGATFCGTSTTNGGAIDVNASFKATFSGLNSENQGTITGNATFSGDGAANNGEVTGTTTLLSATAADNGTSGATKRPLDVLGTGLQ